MIITFQNGMQNYFLIILTVSLLTDFLDGIAARLLDQKSELGKTLDPIADGITLFAFIILFNREGFISNWFTIFYFFKATYDTDFFSMVSIKIKNCIWVKHFRKDGCLFFRRSIMCICFKVR